MSAGHWHYASDIHGGAEEHHRHYDADRAIEELRRDLAAAVDRIGELERRLSAQDEAWTVWRSVNGRSQAMAVHDKAFRHLRPVQDES